MFGRGPGVVENGLVYRIFRPKYEGRLGIRKFLNINVVNLTKLR